jgi:hypothetical protein
MKPTSFEYERPDSLDAAMRLLGDNPGAKLIAGGQSLGPLLNLRLATPSLLIDISRLEELRERAAHDGYVVLGAGVRHAEFEDGRVPAVLNGLFERAARQIAYRAVRNRGTIGGSLAHADPAADWPAIMIALAAEVEARSVRGSRRIPAADLPKALALAIIGSAPSPAILRKPWPSSCTIRSADIRKRCSPGLASRRNVLGRRLAPLRPIAAAMGKPTSQQQSRRISPQSAARII